MFLRGDIQLFVTALFRKFYLYLPRQLFITSSIDNISMVSVPLDVESLYGTSFDDMPAGYPTLEDIPFENKSLTVCPGRMIPLIDNSLESLNSMPQE